MQPVLCPTCGVAVPDGARSCPTCGAPLAEPSAAAPARDHPDALVSGTHLNQGSFSVGRVLGQGGFGITYLGADLRLKRAVAIKEFFPAGSSRRGTSVVLPGALSRPDYERAIGKFTEEARMVARFRHRSIVSVYEVFEENDTAYMVMEYLQGENMLERMERRGAPLDEAELLDLAGPVAEALEEIHATGVLHRDIKPENIMLTGPEKATRPVLIDFGAAREFASGMANRHSIVLTPGYAPLEQYGEQARRGPFTDIYAFAATLYHVATGTQPPASTDRALGVALKDPRTLNPVLTTEFAGGLMHGLEMKVDQRPLSASAFYRELAGVATLDLAPVGSAPPTAAPAASPAPAPAPAPAPRLTPRSPKSPTPSPSPPRPAPTPSPSSAGTHMARVREIARTLGGAGPVRTDILLCPVCRSAALDRRFSASGPVPCPACLSGALQATGPALTDPGVLMRCPACGTGSVTAYARTQMMVVPDLWGRCDNCGAEFDYHTQIDSLTLQELPGGPGRLDPGSLGETRTRAEWQELAGSTAGGYRCTACNSDFRACDGDGLEWVTSGGDPARVPPAERGRCRPRTEWAKLGRGLAAEDGALGCPACRAEFDEPSPGMLMLLRAPSDPAGVASRYRGEQLSEGDWRRVAAGGVPVAEEERLRAEADAEIWEAMRAGELSTSPADTTFPESRGAGENVVVAFGAVQVRSRLGFYYARDQGRVWLTTARLLYQGEHDRVTLPLAEAGRVGLLDVSPDPDASPIVEVARRDGEIAFRFSMNATSIRMTVDGLTLSVPWDEQAFIDLFESLQHRA